MSRGLREFVNRRVCIWVMALIATVSASVVQAADAVTAELLVVTGASGEESWGEEFRGAAEKWAEAAKRGGARFDWVQPTSAPAEASGTQLERLKSQLSKLPKAGDLPLWLVFIGHGTFDGAEGKFNLEGPDLGAQELGRELKAFTRPTVVVLGASASGAFLNELKAPNRVVITATRSGQEQNFSRFGKAMAAAIGDPESDLDHDGQVSALEGFLAASYRVAEFYKSDGRMLTEHALIDDNGDGKGTPAEWYRGIRVVKKAADGGSIDGLRAHQLHLIANERDRALSPEARKRRDALEMELFRLREQRGTAADDAAYLKQLELLLLELGRIYGQDAKP